VNERETERMGPEEGTIREYGNPLEEGGRSDTGQQVREQVEQGRERTAEGVERVAGRVRERAANIPGSERVAEGMEGTARYLREHDTTEIMNDLERYVRQHPMQAVAGAVFAGFLIGRVLR
jgi:hypothetical protein